MIHVHAEAERNTNSAADGNRHNRIFTKNLNMKVGDTVVELDQYKYELSTFQKPLVEVRDSL